MAPCAQSYTVDFLFEDKRATMGLVMLWMAFSCSIFYSLGAFHMQFMTFGPSKGTSFMGMAIDDWGRWSALAVFSFTNTTVNEFLENALGPWFLNTIQDHKTKHLPYSKTTCLVIVQMFNIYSHVMGVFDIFLFFSQIDFLLIRLAADLMVNQYATHKFMANKTVDPAMYAKGRGGEADSQEIEKLLEESDPEAGPAEPEPGPAP